MNPCPHQTCLPTCPFNKGGCKIEESFNRDHAAYKAAFNIPKEHKYVSRSRKELTEIFNE